MPTFEKGRKATKKVLNQLKNIYFVENKLGYNFHPSLCDPQGHIQG